MRTSVRKLSSLKYLYLINQWVSLNEYDLLNVMLKQYSGLNFVHWKYVLLYDYLLLGYVLTEFLFVL